MSPPELALSALAASPAQIALHVFDHDRDLSACPPRARAQALSQIEIVRFAPGEELLSAGHPVGRVLWPISGTIKARDASGREQTTAAGRIGDEGLAGWPARQTLIADDEVEVVALPVEVALALIKAGKGLERVWRRLGEHGGEASAAPAAPIKKKAASGELSVKTRIGWVSLIVVPSLLVLWGLADNWRPETLVASATLTATILMWLFSLVDEYIPPLFASSVALATGIVAEEKVLAGFASSGFLLTMSVFSLGLLLSASGLIYRGVLWTLLKLPPAPIWQKLSILLTGFALSPMMPSANNRMALLLPLYENMMQAQRIAPGSPAANRLASALFSGASLMSPSFPTSKVSNVVILGFLSVQMADQFQGVFWPLAAGAAFLVTLACFLVAAPLLLGRLELTPLPKPLLTAQLKALGPLSQSERLALLAIGAFALGLASLSLHHIAPPWIALLLLNLILLVGALSKAEFREKLDWPFLLFVAGLYGVTAIISEVGIDRRITELLTPILTAGGGDEFPLLILMVLAVVLLVRLAMPINAGMVLGLSIFMPVAAALGINPWVVGFLVAMFSDIWFAPYQCSYYMQLREFNAEHHYFDESSFLRLNHWMNAARVLAAFVSIPYWQWLGLL